MLALEDRWESADQDLFITAVILNPFIGQLRLCFSHIILEWQNNGLYKLLNRVFKRLFKEEAPGSLIEEWTDYRRREGLFTVDNLQLRHFVEKAILLREAPNPVTVWLCIEADNVPLIELALRLFSYTPTSAALERLFSFQSEIEGVKRTSLHANRVADIALVASDIGSKHRDNNRKRKYGSKDYAGDLFLSSKIQCLYHDDDSESTAPAGLDTSTTAEEAETRRWLQSLLDDDDALINPDDGAPSGLITLRTLFDAGSSSDLIASLNEYMDQPWATGAGLMEAETEYYAALLDPLSTVTTPEFPEEVTEHE